MTELWRVWGQECRALLADRALLLTLFGGILFYAYLYPLPYSHQVARQLPVLLVDEDDSLLSRRLAFMADATPQLQLVGRAHTLSEAEQKRWRLHCSDYFSRRLPDYVPRLEALAEQNQGNERNFAILKSLYHYLENL